MPRISTKSAAAREAYIYSLFAKTPDLKVKDAITKLTENKKLGPAAMSVSRVYQIRGAAVVGAGLAPKIKGDELFGGVTGSKYQSATDTVVTETPSQAAA